MKTLKFLFAVIVTVNFQNLSFGQTYNIPGAFTTGTGYIGTVTGALTLKSSLADAILKAPSGNIFINTIGTTTVPNLGINTDGNVGVGFNPPVNPAPGSGYYDYQSILEVRGLTGNNAVPAYSPRTILRLSSSTSGIDNALIFGIAPNNRAFIKSSTGGLSSTELDFYTNLRIFNQSTDGSATCGGKITLGNSGTNFVGDPFANSFINGTLSIGGGTTSSSISTPGQSCCSGPSTYGLYVAKGILTEKVKVAVIGTGAWSDFVFDTNYKLKSLSEVDSYIQKNKHLPDVPSAEEVVKEGIDMATMDAKLLQKIEELTLYMIEMKKENEKLKERILVLETK